MLSSYSETLRRLNTLIFLSCLAAVGACGKKADVGPLATEVPVRVAKVTAKSLPLVVQSVGRAQGSKEVEVRARVSGILEQQTYTEGASIKAGAVLFRIESAPFEIALEQARAALAQERARNDQARRNAKRITALLGEKAISQREADDALSNLEASDAAVLVAQANVREAELNLSYTRVIAPISGITGRALRSQGSLLQAGAESSLLTTITQADPIWVYFAISQAEHERVRQASRGEGENTLDVSLLRPDGSTYPMQGRINFAASTVDTRVGTVQLRAEFSNPELALLPGEYVQVKLAAGAHTGIAVPQTAVLQGDQGRFVWTVDQQGKAAPRPIEIGPWLGSEWAVQSGLAEGETIILDNLMKLRPGVAVKPIHETTAATADEQTAGRTGTVADKQ